jgi:hypothetical protein
VAQHRQRQVNLCLSVLQVSSPINDHMVVAVLMVWMSTLNLT